MLTTSVIMSKISLKDAEELQKLNDKVEAKLTFMREKLVESKTAQKDYLISCEQHFKESHDVSNLRPIVIDGCNVAISHGNKEFFSCHGIKICVDWFKARGHREITVFVPMWRKESSTLINPIKDREILFQLESEKILVFTPSRLVAGRRMTCHDDLYILNLALQNDGVVVSNDNYRDLINRNPEYKKVVEDRLLMYSFVNDRFMPPDDPLGRHGPTLDAFLRKKDPSLPHCPYGKKCTYGNKCKYYHPEPQKTITERLLEQTNCCSKDSNPRNIESIVDGSGHEKLRIAHTASCPPNGTSSDLNKSVVAKKPPPHRPKHQQATNSMSFPLDGRKGKFAPLNGHNTVLNSDAILNQVVDQNFTKGASCESATNVHRKLARQLTINPTFDPRLVKMQTFETNKLLNKGRNCEKKNPSQQAMINNGHRQVMRIRSDSGLSAHSSTNGSLTQIYEKNTASGSNGFINKQGASLEVASNGSQKNQNLNLTTNNGEHSNMQNSSLSSSSINNLASGYRDWQKECFEHSKYFPPLESQSLVHGLAQGYPYFDMGPYTHPNVTRISSAPDSNHGWPSSQKQNLVNTNSDSCLNVNPNAPLVFHDSVQMNHALASLYQASSLWSDIETLSPCLTLPNNSPISSQSSPGLFNSQTHQQLQNQVQSDNLTSFNSNSISSSESHWSSSAAGLTQLLPLNAKQSCPILDNLEKVDERKSQSNVRTYRSLSSELFSDNPRSKLYFHLTQIFPENHVKAAMDMLPDETDAKTICAAILSISF